MKPNTEKSNWVWGLAGSGFNLILYCLSLYRLKREVLPKDYLDFQVMWWSFVLSLSIAVLLLSAVPDWALGVILAKGVVIAFSIPVCIVVQTADVNGFVIQRVFGGIKTKTVIRPLLGIIALCGTGALFLLGVEYKGLFKSIVTLMTLNVNLVLLWFLVRNFRAAISGK